MVATSFARYFYRPTSTLKSRGTLLRAAEITKSDSRLAIIDFRVDSPNGLPKAVRIAPEQVKNELQRAGYVLAGEHDFLPNQYFLVFRAGN